MCNQLFDKRSRLIQLIKKRLNIFIAIVSNNRNVKNVTLISKITSLLQLNGLVKFIIRHKMTCEEFGENYRLTIHGKSIYWPKRADRNRVTDMYFEVFNMNNHKFDIDCTRLKIGDVVIDAGCCEGYFALKAVARGAAKVYCFEPGRSIQKCLEMTFLDEIKMNRIKIVPMLLGNIDNKYMFVENINDPTIGHIKNGEGAGEAYDMLNNNLYPIVMTKLDTYISINRLNRVDFIKCDIEGAELEFISGAVDTIKRYCPRMAIAVYHSPDHADLLIQMIKSINSNYKFKLKGVVDIDGVVRPVMLHCYLN